jgi:hypothetical protein
VARIKLGFAKNLAGAEDVMGVEDVQILDGQLFAEVLGGNDASLAGQAAAYRLGRLRSGEPPEGHSCFLYNYRKNVNSTAPSVAR